MGNHDVVRIIDETANPGRCKSIDAKLNVSTRIGVTEGGLCHSTHHTKMAKNNKIQMPSGQGGLQRFDEEVGNFLISPGAVVIICVVAMFVIIALHMVGGAFF